MFRPKGKRVHANHKKRKKKTKGKDKEPWVASQVALL